MYYIGFTLKQAKNPGTVRKGFQIPKTDELTDSYYEQIFFLHVCIQIYVCV